MAREKIDFEIIVAIFLFVCYYDCDKEDIFLEFIDA